METLIYTNFSLGLLFAVFTMIVIIGFLKVQKPAKMEKRDRHVSVIIPFRNEEEHIPQLLDSLFKQTFPSTGLNFVFVDDHSTDGSCRILRELLAGRREFRSDLFHLENAVVGKKAAVDLGIRKAGEEIILVTDADCVHSIHWAESMTEALFIGNTDMVIGPVETIRGNGLLAGYSYLEQAGLCSVAIGSAGIGYPLLCSGANLAYKKELFNTLGGYEGNMDVPSGDDMFLLRKACLSGKRIAGCSGSEALVTTRFNSTLREILTQRQRWTGKIGRIADIRLFALGFLLTVLSVTTVLTPIFSALSGSFSAWHLVPLGLKILCDFLLVFLPAFVYRRLPELLWFLPAFFLNMFLVITLGALLIARKKVDWKGRSVPT